jgi:hypothetical protein
MGMFSERWAVPTLKDVHKLKACPFCGSDDLHITKTPSRDGSVIFFKISHPATSECSVSIIDTKSEENLIRIWNQRV